MKQVLCKNTQGNVHFILFSPPHSIPRKTKAPIKHAASVHVERLLECNFLGRSFTCLHPPHPLRRIRINILFVFWKMRGKSRLISATQSGGIRPKKLLIYIYIFFVIVDGRSILTGISTLGTYSRSYTQWLICRTLGGENKALGKWGQSCDG